MRNRFLFLILLICFSCVRVGWDRWHREEAHTRLSPERKLLIWDEETSQGALDSLTYEYDSQSQEGTSPPDDEEPPQSTTCKTKFDKTIGVVLFTAGVLYCFVGLAIICEGEFKDSVVELARFLKLPPDVAGATLMAAGTSSPELFTSLVAIAGPVADIGTGTIVGSAIFNILIIIGSCVLFSSHIFHLSWKPVLRDTLVNIVSFAFLYIVFYDGYIYWYEALLGCFLYIAYVGMMGFNAQVMLGMDWVATKAVSAAPFLQRMGPGESAPARHRDDPHQVEGNVSESSVNLLADYEDRIPGGAQVELGDVAEPPGDEKDEEAQEVQPRTSLQEDADFDEAEEESDHFPTSVWGWVWYVLAWPYELVFRYTIPPVKGRYKYQFIASFFLSLAWLAVFSTMMVKWTEEIGCVLGIEDAIMGVTFLAVGTSLPDCLTSIFVARTGRGNMAVCNALGSNVFDILLALSLPWVLSILLSGEPVNVASGTLNEDVIVLTGTVLVFFVTMCVNRWRLTKPIGVFFFVLYALFVTYTVLKEMGILSF